MAFPMSYKLQRNEKLTVTLTKKKPKKRPKRKKQTKNLPTKKKETKKMKMVTKMPKTIVQMIVKAQRTTSTSRLNST